MSDEMIVIGVVISFFGWRISRLLKELIEVSTKEKIVPYGYIEEARKAMGYMEKANPNYWLLLAIITLLSDGDF